MSESFSTATVLGALRRPPHLSITPAGSAYALFEVLLRRQTATGAWFTVSVPCKAWGRGVDIARSLQAGQVVLFKGELATHKGIKGDLLCVSGYDL